MKRPHSKTAKRSRPLRVTALFDGVVALPRSLLVGVAPERIASLLHQRYVPEDE